MALTKDALIRCLVDEYDVDEDDLQDDTLLFSTGLLDSFSMVSLVSFIEKEAGFKVRPVDFQLENLDSVERILAFVARAA